MSERVVTSQSELDAALADQAPEITIRSPRGVRLTIGATGDSEVVVTGESCIDRVYGGGTVERVYGGGTVERVDGGGTVKWVYGGGTVERVYGGGTVERVDGGGTVKWVYGGGTVKWVYGGGTVKWVSGDAAVHLYGNSRLGHAGSHVAVFLHDSRATFEGGHLIDLTTVDQTDPIQWAGYHGAAVDTDTATVYKAVRDDLRSQHGLLYEIGAEVSCDDFEDTDACGRGLHFSPSPIQAKSYDEQATRFLECTVLLSELRPITGSGTAKAKAPRAQVVREVDLSGDPIVAVASSVASS